MTVSNTTVKASYQGNGSTRTFSVPFPILSADHLRLVVTDADGWEQDIVADYALSDDLATLTYPTVESEQDPLPSGYTLTIVRTTPQTQELDLHASTTLDAEQLEAAYDKIVLMVQELKEQLDRALKYRISQTDTHTAEEYLEVITQAQANAQTAATAAANHANTASEKASQASTSQVLATGYATDASNYAAQAAESANTALQYKTAAATAASNANISAQDAYAAKEDAVDAEAVVAGYKDTAAGYASAAGLSASAAANSATSADNAKIDAVDAKTAAQTAKVEANNAADRAEEAQAAAEAAAAGCADAQTLVNTHNTSTTAHEDLRTALAGKQDKLTAGTNVTIVDNVISATGGGGGGSVDVDGSLDPNSPNPVANSALYAAITAKQDALSTVQLNAANSGVTAAKVSGYDTHVDNGDIHVTAAQKTTWSGKQDTITDLATIRTNAAAGKSAADAQATYGDVVTHDASDFQAAGSYAAASHTHTKADISNFPAIPSKTSDLVNDSGFITSVPVATTATAGKVKPDGITTTVAADGTLTAVGGGSSSGITATYDSTNKILTLE